jgi:hypothetical protein
MSERIQTTVPDELFERMQKRAPGGEQMGQSEIMRYWVAYAMEAWELRRAEAGLPVDERL